MFRLCAFLIAAVLMAAGCGASDEINEPADDPNDAVEGASPASPPTPTLGGEDAPDPEDIVSAVGTVTRVELEGGFYGIVVAEADTARYNPMNLEAAYQQDGLRVRFRGRLRTDVMTTQQWGRPLEILEIVKLEE